MTKSFSLLTSGFVQKILAGIWQHISHNPDKRVIVSYVLAGLLKSVK